MQHTTQNIYAMVTDRIIAQLEKGTIPWKQPWAQAPQNLITKRPYRGINALLLHSLQFSSPFFLSFNQVNTLGGSVKKGEKSTPVVFWKQSEHVDDDTGEVSTRWLLRYYTVFNTDQCEGIPSRIIPALPERIPNIIPACKKIVKEMLNPPAIKTIREDKACYIPLMDCIMMPSAKRFASDEAYYHTLFHELVHSTGHHQRLSRREVLDNVTYGTDLYSIEELTAEMGACFLGSAGGILEMTIENSAAYIQGWLTVFKNDKKILLKASSAAQRAADYILNLQSTADVGVPDASEAVVE